MPLFSVAKSEPLFSNAAAHTLKNRSVRGAAITFAGQLVRFTFQFASQVIMARLLDPNDFGLLAMVSPVIVLVQLFNELGLSQATIQRPEINRRDVSSLFWINFLASVGLASLVALAAPAIGAFYHEPRTVPITAILAFVLVLGGLSSQQMALLGRAMRFRQLAIIDIASMAATTFAGLVSALAGLGYWSLVIMPFALMTTTVILSWIYTGWIPDRPSRNANIGSMMRFGGHLTGANILGYISRNLDNILIGKVYGSDMLGLYDRAYKLMLLPLSQISAPVSRVAVPLLSRLQNDPVRYRAAYLQMLQAIHLAAIPGMVAAIALPDQVVLTLFGEKWAGVAPIFFWLAIAGVTSFVGSSMGWLFTSQDRTPSQFRWGMVSTTLFVTSFLVGLPYGAVGVARAYACVGVLIQGPLVWFGVTRQGPVRLVDILKTVYPFVFSGACALVVLLACQRVYDFHGISGLMAGGAISYAVSALALLMLPEGRRVMRNAVALRTMMRRQD